MKCSTGSYQNIYGPGYCKSNSGDRLNGSIIPPYRLFILFTKKYRFHDVLFGLHLLVQVTLEATIHIARKGTTAYNVLAELFLRSKE